MCLRYMTLNMFSTSLFKTLQKSFAFVYQAYQYMSIISEDE